MYIKNRRNSSKFKNFGSHEIWCLTAQRNHSQDRCVAIKNCMQINSFYILIFILFFSSCGIRSVNYKKARSLDSKKGYKTLLNKETEIELGKYFLDTKNITKITADRKTKTLNVLQSNKNPESFNLTEIESAKFKKRYEMTNRDSISLIVLNGILVEKSKRKDYRIEHNAVKNLLVLKDADATILNCSGNGGKNVLIILTE